MAENDTPAPAVPAYITALEDLLVQARAGSLRAVALVAVNKERQITRVVEIGSGMMRNDLAAAVGDLFYGIYAVRDMEYVDQGEKQAAPEKT